MLRNIRMDHLSVGRSVCPQSVLWQNACWIRMPFGVVSGVGPGIYCGFWGDHQILPVSDRLARFDLVV